MIYLMEPQQQYPPAGPPYQPQPTAPQPSADDPYHFIMNPAPAPKRMSLGSPKGLLFVIGAVAAVIIILVVILAVIRGGGTDTKPYVTLVTQQQEIVRVAGLEESSLRQQNVKNFVMNTQLSMASDQAQLKEFLSKNGVKISSKELAKTAHKDTDTRLADAVSSSTLDSVLVSELQQELADYQAALARAYKASSSKNTRALLTELHDHATLLLTQSKQ
jgi:hypothetical protein